MWFYYCFPLQLELVESLKNLLASLREGILTCERQMEEEQRKLRRLCIIALTLYILFTITITITTGLSTYFMHIFMLIKYFVPL